VYSELHFGQGGNVLTQSSLRVRMAKRHVLYRVLAVKGAQALQPLPKAAMGCAAALRL
jgi:hypothetical protein